MVKRRVLFLCTHNAVRSQISEALLRELYGDKYTVYSAGASPTQIHPLAIEVMKEIGIDLSDQRSKSIEEFKGKKFDLVITVCKDTPKLSCPFCSPPSSFGVPKIIKETLDAKHFIEHGFDDPSGVQGSKEERLEAFREVRDEIKTWIKEKFKNRDNIE